MNHLVISRQKLAKSQPDKCEYLQVFLVSCNTKLIIFGFCTVSQTKQAF